MAFNNEIEEVKAQIQVLQSKLSFLEELEKTKSPVEEAYKEYYGKYPITDDMSGGDMDYVSWDAFQKGYNAAYEEKVTEKEMIKRNIKTSLREMVNGDVRPIGDVVKEAKEDEEWNAVRESVKWCEENPDKDPLDCLKPQTPEQTEQSLKEAFVEAQKTEKWKEIQKKIDAPAEGIYDNIDMDKLLEKWEKDPPEFLKFELGQSLTDLIWKWWEDVFTIHEEWDAENAIEELVNRIELFLPKEQTANSQNAYVESAVEGFNDAIQKIKRKLR